MESAGLISVAMKLAELSWKETSVFDLLPRALIFHFLLFMYVSTSFIPSNPQLNSTTSYQRDSRPLITESADN